MARMQRFELSLNNTVKLLTLRAPLDSTAIYPITRSPNNHYETGKQENLSRLYLCLVHSIWARLWWPLFSSRWNTFLDCARLYLLDEDSHKLIHTQYGRASFGTSSHIHYQQIYGKLQAYSLFEMSILNLHFSLINLESFLQAYSLFEMSILNLHFVFSSFNTFFTGDSGVSTLDTPATLGSTLTRPFFGSSLNITCLD